MEYLSRNTRDGLQEESRTAQTRVDSMVGAAVEEIVRAELDIVEKVSALRDLRRGLLSEGQAEQAVHVVTLAHTLTGRVSVSW